MDVDIKQSAHALKPKLVEWRRHLHAYPELSFQEFETAKYIAIELRKIEGMKVQTGVAKTGVVGTLSNGVGPTVALRADIDALPIQEENINPYCSKHSGVMHACGHDAHPAIALGAATIMAQLIREGLIRGTVKFIFQPAEECTDETGLSGAPYMIEEGVLTDVEAILALHMCPWLPVGKIQINDGFSMANVDVFKAKIRGKGGHGAYPQLGLDSIWLTSQILQLIYSFPTRKLSPLEPAILSVGKIEGGAVSNVIPTEVLLEGTLRSYSPTVRKELWRELERVFKLVESAGGSYELEIIKGEPALKNDPMINSWIVQTMGDLFPEMEIIRGPFGLGGEDFGYMTREVPGAMFFLGCALADGDARDLHTPTFDINEECLPVGASIMAETLRRYLSKEVKCNGTKK